MSPSSPGKGARSSKKILFWLLPVVLLAACGAGYYYWNKAHAKPRYVTADVTRGDVERSVSVTGSINPRNTVQVGSYVSGTVKSLNCDFNTQVKAGQVCATIDPSTFQVAVDQAAAQLNSAKAQLQKDEAALVYAKGVFERDGKLIKDGVVAQEVADNDKNVYKQAQAQIDLDKAAIVAAEANLKSAQVNLGYTKITSPVTGTVLTRNVDVGQTVASSLQTPTLFLIGKDMTQMQVDANVSEADVGRIRVDQEVSFSVQAYPDKAFEGKVKQIRRGPITVQNVVTYDVVVTVDNPDLLLFPGMTADAQIVTESRENVLRVPLAATRFTPEGMHADFARGNGGEAGKRKHGDDDDAPAAAPAASVSASASAAAASASASASAPASDERRGQHRGEGRGRGDGTGHRHQHGDGNNGSGGSGNGDDPERAERRRAWMREHAGEFAQGGQGAGGHGGWRRRHEQQADDDKSDKGDKNEAGAKDDGKDARPETKSDKAGKAAKPDDKSSDDKPADMNDTVAATAPLPPAPRKRVHVWVMRDGKPVAVAIVIGLDDGDTVEVLEGDLKPGDKVIVNEVRPVEQAAPRSAAMPSPFNQGGAGGGMRGGGGGMRR